MIRKNLINSNLIGIKKSGKALFRDYMASFHPGTEQCPYCKAKGGCSVFAYYFRFLIDFIGGHPDTIRIKVMRVRCTCGATHAILFDPIIPYEQHSLFFILEVLAEYFLHLKTIDQICCIYEISISTFYRWKELYDSHRKEWEGKLKSAETELIDSILELICSDTFADFASEFLSITGMTFLQSHKNPAPYQRRQKSPDSDFP